MLHFAYDNFGSTYWGHAALGCGLHERELADDSDVFAFALNKTCVLQALPRPNQ